MLFFAGSNPALATHGEVAKLADATTLDLDYCSKLNLAMFAESKVVYLWLCVGSIPTSCSMQLYIIPQE